MNNFSNILSHFDGLTIVFVFASQSEGEDSRKSRLSEGSSSAKNNGDVIDYKALYEAQK